MGQTYATNLLEKFTLPLRLTRCRWCVEGDLRAVGAEQGVPAASDPEGVQAVRFQVTHHSAGTINPVCSPPDPTVLTVLLGRGLARAAESGEKGVYSQVIYIFPQTYSSSVALHSPPLFSCRCFFVPAVFKHVVICR